jgi:hypothetical protein
VVGRQFQTPSNALAEAEQRATGRANVAVAALSGLGDLLRDLGDSVQQADAENGFYKVQDEILKALDKNPGQGALVEFVFHRFEPHPDAVIHPGDRFQPPVVWYLAASRTDIQPGVYQGEKGATLHIRRRWIPPTRQPSARPDTPAADTREAIAIKDNAHLDRVLDILRQQTNVSATNLVVAFKKAKHVDFSTSRVEVGSFVFDIPAGTYEQAIPKLEAAATAALTNRFNTLAAALQDLRKKYEQYRGEDWFIRMLKQREFELPPPKLLDSGDDSLKLGREWLAKKDFELARSHLRTGNERARNVEFLLFHYSHGYRHPLEDE